jgi:hypothetical protein
MGIKNFKTSEDPGFEGWYIRPRAEIAKLGEEIERD